MLDHGPHPSGFFSGISDGRVSYIHRPDDGLGADALGAKRNALNSMARAAGAFFIAQFDDDDVYLPDYLARTIHALHSCHADLVNLACFTHWDAVDDVLYRYRVADDAIAGHHARKWGYGFTFVYRRRDSPPSVSLTL